jgi:uncharacterized protein
MSWTQLEMDGDGIDRVSDQELEELPIFPLSQCVLLPGGLMPLHVFEPRYRELTKHCLDGNRPMGIARLKSGRERDGQSCRDDVFQHVGVGRIICSEEVEDGRFLLLLRGVDRVVIDRELPRSYSFRRVAARRLVDIAADPAAVRHLHEQLMALCDRLAMVLEEGGRQLAQLACGSIPGACADAVAAALLMDADQRQALLEQADPHARLSIAVAQVSRLLCQVVPCDGEVN